MTPSRKALRLWGHRRSRPRSYPPIALAVSLAGVVDLGYAVEHRLSSDAVVMALGGTPDEVPGRYAAADPARFERRRAPWLLVQGTGDSADFIAMNRRVSARPELGHPELLEAPGDHFAIIDPASPLWRATVARVEALLA
ncbi:hypothetical protein [Subtercola sp. RTI3]|uniref:alpha/beta hydrolase family protein n=1 Tax=Subtercola sp. RTI3 TaxID=3048639 RepID=UPI002B229EA0|nr:hypothetical protein [Subtercola sp. RTI3]MEA9987110.1 hypothetical protein [Subtercola sp. RTI3]